MKHWLMLQHDEPWKQTCQVKETRHKRAHSIWFHFYEICRIGKSVETQSGFMAARGHGGWGEGQLGLTASQVRNFFRKWWNVLELSGYSCITLCCCAKSLQSCSTLCDPMDCSPPGSSVHGILQARILEWVAMPSSRGSSWPRNWTCTSYVSSISRQVLYH